MLRAIYLHCLLIAVVLCDFAAAGQRWALLIGADNYHSYGKLEFCGADARALAEVLKEKCGYENVVVLTDQEDDLSNKPTLTAIRRRIAGIAQSAETDDTIFVFFSGHGLMKDGRGYLVPIDGDADNLISMEWVKSTLQSSPASRRILIMDACHAGSGAKGISAIVPDIAAPNLIVFMSSGSDEISYPNDTQTHSIFTEKLLKGLEGEAAEDGLITVRSLFMYINTEMRRWSFESGRSQTPALHPAGIADVPLVVLPRNRTLPDHYRRQHDSAVDEGTSLLAQRNWTEAEAVFRRALSTPGFTTSEAALDGVRTAREGKQRSLDYEAAVNKLKERYESAKDSDDLTLWREVREAALVAMNTGYADSQALSLYLNEAHEKLLPIPIPSGWTAAIQDITTATPAGNENRQIAYYVNSIGMEFVYIPPGQFTMGSPDAEAKRGRDETIRQVTFTRGFLISAVPVTQQHWLMIMGTRPSKFQSDNHPIEQVSWDDAAHFARMLSDAERHSYRLPMEAEWEFACRAGSTTPFSWGHSISTLHANYDGNFAYSSNPSGIYRMTTTPVKTFSPNEWGLYDMHGNVWEWCYDWYGSLDSAPAVDPKGTATGRARVVRGGSWHDYPHNCRSAARHKFAPIYRNQFTGFRVCVDLPQQEKGTSPAP